MDTSIFEANSSHSDSTVVASKENTTLILRSFESGESHSIIGNMVIGRESDCGICLNHKKVSRYHAKVHVVDNGIMVSDLQSSNGTFVNGIRVTNPVAIEVGDEVQFGDKRYRLTSVVNTVENDATILSEPSLVFPASKLSSSKASVPNPRFEETPHPSVDVPPPTPEVNNTRLISPESLRTTAARNSTTDAVNEGSGPRLVVNTAPIRGQMFSLADVSNQSISIGREDDNDIVLPDLSVSRHHASLTYDQEGFLIRTTSASNGLLVNGFNVQQWRLQEGDSIQLGRVNLAFKVGQSLPKQPASPESEVSQSKYLIMGALLLLGTILIATPWFL